MSDLFIALSLLALAGVVVLLVLSCVLLWRKNSEKREAAAPSWGSSPPPLPGVPAPGAEGAAASPSPSPDGEERRAKPPIARGWIAKLATVAALALLSLIPVALIGQLVDEREERMMEVAGQLSREFGPGQTLTGPILAVPVTIVTERIQTVQPASAPGEAPAPPKEIRTSVNKLRWVAMTPESLEVDAKIEPELRKRGIYSALVYTASVEVKGAFQTPPPKEIENLAGLGGKLEEVHWDQARLVLGLTENRSLREVGALSLGGRRHQFQPGGDDVPGLPKGISAEVDLAGRGGRLEFSLSLAAAGSSILMVAPTAETNSVSMASSWPHPSFTGSSLPVGREVGADGFTAQWRVPSLVRSYKSLRVLPDGVDDDRQPTVYEGFTVGASLMDPVDGYHRVNRAVKYAIMLISLSLLVFLLWERSLGRGSIHPVQYGVVVLALALFFLALLALYEHLGFGPAYLAASALDVGMVGAYSLAVTRRPAGAAVVAGLLALLHAALFMVLSMEDYALLAGTALLAAALAAVMISTSRLADQEPA